MAEDDDTVMEWKATDRQTAVPQGPPSDYQCLPNNDEARLHQLPPGDERDL